MNNGEYYFNNQLRALFHRIALFSGCIACLLFVGCRSSRNSVAETHREVHTAVKEGFTADTLNSAISSSEMQTDTATLHADERAVISITRDSAGRVVEIRAERHAKVNANVSRKADSDSQFYGFNATCYSETSGSVDSVTKKKEEAKTEVKIGIPLGSIIIWGLAAMVVIYLMYCFITETMLPWINRLKK